MIIMLIRPDSVNEQAYHRQNWAKLVIHHVIHNPYFNIQADEFTKTS